MGRESGKSEKKEYTEGKEDNFLHYLYQRGHIYSAFATLLFNLLFIRLFICLFIYFYIYLYI